METPRNPNTTLSAAEKAAMLRVFDGEPLNSPVGHALFFLDLHLPRAFLVPALELLIKDQLTGKKLADFLTENYDARDFLEFQRWLLARLEKRDVKTYHLIAGINFKIAKKG